MQKLLADFLFKNKYCSIPNVGTLQLVETAANSIFGEQKIAAPFPEILFSTIEKDTDELKNFIVSEKKATSSEVVAFLEKLGGDINALTADGKINIPNAGDFYKNQVGEISFTQEALVPHFTPPVMAHRVVHPNSTHTMLVGETETNTASMAEYLAEDEPTKKSKWWIAAVIIAVLAAAAIGFYFTDINKNTFFGNSNKVNGGTAEPTYKTLP
jgi:hypothetical protein